VSVGIPLGGGQGVGENILGDGGSATNVGVLPYTAELMHGAERTHTGMVLDSDVAGQGSAIGQDAVAADGAVVPDVGVGHDQAVVADPGRAATSPGATGEGHAFADGVVV